MVSAVSGFSLPQLRVSRRYAWVVNRLAIAATCAVVYTSAALEAVEHGKSPYIAGGFAMAWPLSLLGSDIILTRVPNVGSASSFRVRRFGTAVIAVCAFVGSAEHSISLALWMGAPLLTALTAPIILDGLIITSGQSLVDLAEEIFKAKKPVAEPVEVSPVDSVPTQPMVTPERRPALDKPPSTERSTPASKPVPVSKQPVSSARSSVSSDEVAAALEGDPSLTAKALGERFDVSAKTISRTAGWKNRKKKVAA